jgi:hypothetical protein
MSKEMIRIHNAETGETIDREMTDEEYSNYLNIQKQFQEEQEKLIEMAKKRQDLLDKLGITEEEAQLLLGGN